MGNTCSCCSNGIKLPAVEDVNHLDEAISFLETRLDAILIDKPKESTSGTETNSASVVSSIEYGSYFLETVVRRVKRHTYKSVDSNSEIQKVVTDILKEAEQVQWARAGLAAVTYVLDQMYSPKHEATNQPFSPRKAEWSGCFHCKRIHLVSFSELVDEEEIKSLQSQLVVKYVELGQYSDEDTRLLLFSF